MKAFGTAQPAVDVNAGHAAGKSRSRWGGWRRSGVIVAAVALLTGSGGIAFADPVNAGAVTQQKTEVLFNDCSEFAGITTISVAEARTVVPASFTLGGDASGAPFVVRVANCSGVSIDGSASVPGTVAQVGVSIVSPDDTGGDINNYTVWYYTTSLRLALKLQLMGVPAQWVPSLVYHVTPNSAHTGGTLAINVAAGRPAFRVDAPVVEPLSDPGLFTANWWIQSGARLTKMSTPIPRLRFGGATATLQTARAGQLGRLLESSTETFALLDSYNRFDFAPMTVSVGRR